MEREELMELLEEIQDRNEELFPGRNEANLMIREDIADLFERIVGKKKMIKCNSFLPKHTDVTKCTICGGNKSNHKKH